MQNQKQSATMGGMLHLRRADLLADAPIDPEAHLDTLRVERYAQILDALPPVVVFDTPEGQLLADGYHRVASARCRCLESVEPEVPTGSRHDALRYAARGAGTRVNKVKKGRAGASIGHRHSTSRAGLVTLGGGADFPPPLNMAYGVPRRRSTASAMRPY